MKRIYPTLMLIVLTALMATPLFAAAYVIQINVVESAGVSYTRLPMIATLNNTYLAANGLIASNALDTRVINSANVTLPHLVADNKTLFVDNITASSTAVFQYKSGQSALTSMPTVVGQGGYVTTADNATLEPSDNFSLTISGYFPMSGSGDIFKKLDALRLSYSGTVLTFKAGDNATPDVTLTATMAEGEHVVRVATSAPGSHTYEYFALGNSPLGGGIRAGGDWRTGFTLTAQSTHTINVVQALLYRIGTGSGNLTMYMYAGYGGALIATSDPVASGAITTDTAGELVNFTFSEQTMTSGNSYFFYISGSAGDADNKIMWLYSYDTLPVGWRLYLYFDAGWHSYTGVIAAFIIIGGNPPPDYPKLNLYVDDMAIPMDSDSMTVPIPDNSSDWIFYPDPYFNYIKLETGN